MQGNASLERILPDRHDSEVGDTDTRPSSTEAKPSLRQRLRVEIADDWLSVDCHGGASSCTFYPDMIPMVGLQQVFRVGIFFQDGRSIAGTVHSPCVTRISTEAGGGVAVATIA